MAHPWQRKDVIVRGVIDEFLRSDDHKIPKADHKIPKVLPTHT